MATLRFPVVSLLPVVLGVASCGSLSVIQQSGPPSALLPVTQIYVVTDQGSFTVEGDSEQTFVADLDAEEVEDWEQAKGGMHAAVIKALQEEVPGVQVVGVAPNAVPNEPNAAVLTVKYIDVFPGHYGFGSDDAVVSAQLSFAVGGSVGDVVQIKVDADADRYRPTMKQRLINCGEDLGEEVGEFFNAARAP